MLHKLLGLTVCRLDQVVRRGPLRANLLLVPQCTIEFGFGLVNKLNCLFASKPREFTEDFFGSRFQMLQMKMNINEYEIQTFLIKGVLLELSQYYENILNEAYFTISGYYLLLF